MDKNESILHAITDEFIVETYDLLELVSGSLLDLEKSQDAEIVNSIYRVFHTIKGNAYLAGFTAIGELAHKLEDVLSIIKTGGLRVTSQIIDHLLSSIDLIKVMTENIDNNIDEEIDTSTIIKAFDSLIAGAYQEDISGLNIDPEPHNEPEAIELNDGQVVNTITQDKKAGYGDNYKEDDILNSLAKNSFRPLRILVVEDDFTSRQLLVAALSKYGECHIAKDGLEAVQAVIESYEATPTAPYDLICMDVQMPNMDGTVASKTIREIERGKDIEGTEFESIIIMISCVEDPRVIMKACYKCGANHYFVKPLDLNQMTRQMQKLGLIGVAKKMAPV